MNLNITGSKLYLAALLGMVITARLTIGESPFSSADQQTIGWVLNIVATPLTVILGPEVADTLKGLVYKLAGRVEATTLKEDENADHTA